MRNTVRILQTSNSDLLYFLSAFAIAVIFVIALGNLKPIATKTGNIRLVSVKIAASAPEKTAEEYRFDHGG